MSTLPLHLTRLISEAPGIDPALLLVHAIRRANRDLIRSFR